MDVGRLDDIFKNMAVQVKHGRPQNPVHQNMDVHGLKTSKTWTSKIWKHGRPCYLKRKYGRSNVVWSDRMLNNWFFCSTWIENNDVSTLFVTSTSTPRDAVTVLPVEFSKWIFEICKICKIYLILTTYSITFDVATTTKSWRARNINTASASKCKIYRCIHTGMKVRPSVNSVRFNSSETTQFTVRFQNLSTLRWLWNFLGPVSILRKQ